LSGARPPMTLSPASAVRLMPSMKSGEIGSNRLTQNTRYMPKLPWLCPSVRSKWRQAHNQSRRTSLQAYGFKENATLGLQLVERGWAHAVLPAQLGSRQTSLLPLFFIPMICASVKRLSLMSSAPSQVGQTPHHS
jgi:hypothetical protein